MRFGIMLDTLVGFAEIDVVFERFLFQGLQAATMRRSGRVAELQG